jgi:hypothetical protein
LNLPVFYAAFFVLSSINYKFLTNEKATSLAGGFLLANAIEFLNIRQLHFT